MKQKILKKALILLLAITLLIGSTISSFAVTCDHYSNLQNVVTKSPTCTEPGSMVLSCAKCGLFISYSLIPELGHNYVFIKSDTDIFGKPYSVYGCTRCGYSTVIGNY